jgi:hypothetical protein
MPFVKLVQTLYQFLFALIALELTFLSPVTKLVILLLIVNILINTITVKLLKSKGKEYATVWPSKR